MPSARQIGLATKTQIMYLTRKTSIIITILIIMGFLVIAQYSSPSTAPLPKENLSSPLKNTETLKDPIPDQQAKFELHSFERNEVKNGKKIWEITAEKGSFDPLTQLTSLLKANLQVFKDAGDNFSVGADQAFLYSDGSILKKVDLTKNVILILNKNVTLKTEAASYLHETSEVISPTKVLIQGPFYTSVGDSMHALVETQVITLEGHVETTLSPVDNKE